MDETQEKFSADADNAMAAGIAPLTGFQAIQARDIDTSASAVSRADRIRNLVEAPDFEIPEYEPLDSVVKNYHMTIDPDVARDMVQRAGIHRGAGAQTAVAIENALMDLGGLGDLMDIAYGNVANWVSGGTVGKDLQDIAYKSIEMRMADMSRNADSVGGIESFLAKLSAGALSMAELALVSAATYGVGGLAQMGVQAMGEGTYNDMKAYADKHNGSIEGYVPEGADIALNFANALLQMRIEAKFGVASPRFLHGTSRGLVKEGLSGALQEASQSFVSDINEVLKGNQEWQSIVENAHGYIEDAVIGGLLQGTLGAATHYNAHAKAVNDFSNVFAWARGRKTPNKQDIKDATSYVNAQENEDAVAMTEEFKRVFDEETGTGELYKKTLKALNDATAKHEDWAGLDETQKAQRLTQIAQQETLRALRDSMEKGKGIESHAMNAITYKDGAIWVEGLEPEIGDRAVAFSRVLAERQSGLNEIQAQIDGLNQEIKQTKQELAEAKKASKTALAERLQAQIEKQEARAQKRKADAEKIRGQIAKAEQQAEKRQVKSRVDDVLKKTARGIEKKSLKAEREAEKKSGEQLMLFQKVTPNRGYVGYSYSVRSAQARENGIMPKTQAAKVLGIPAGKIPTLPGADKGEWHHTGLYANRTPHYDVYNYITLLENQDALAFLKDYYESEWDFLTEEDIDAIKDAFKKKLPQSVYDDLYAFVRGEKHISKEEYEATVGTPNWEFGIKYYDINDFELSDAKGIVALPEKPSYASGIDIKKQSDKENIQRKNQIRKRVEEIKSVLPASLREEIDTERRGEFLYPYAREPISVFEPLDKVIAFIARLHRGTYDYSNKKYWDAVNMLPPELVAEIQTTPSFNRWNQFAKMPDETYKVYSKTKTFYEQNKEQLRQFYGPMDLFWTIKDGLKTDAYLPYFHQGSVKGAGDTYRGGFDEKLKRIVLSEKSDLSTIQHEFAHYWIQNNFKWARSGLATADWLDKWRKVEDWLGVRPDDRFLSREASERFARAYERFVMDGREVPELAWAYQGFSDFYNEIYEDELKAEYFDLDAELSQDVVDWFNAISNTEPVKRAQVAVERIGREMARRGNKVVDKGADGTITVSETDGQGGVQTSVFVPVEKAEGSKYFETSGKEAEAGISKTMRDVFGEEVDPQRYAKMDKDATVANAEVQVNADRQTAIDKMLDEKTDAIDRAALYNALVNDAVANNDASALIALSGKKMSDFGTKLGQAVALLDVDSETGFDVAKVANAVRDAKGDMTTEQLNDALKEIDLDSVELSESDAIALENETECQL